MTTRTLVLVAAVVETGTGLGLIAIPDPVVQLLLGTDLSSGGVAVGRVAGVALLSLGVACWPGEEAVTPQVMSALFIYNVLVTVYLAYLGASGVLVGYLLWPVVALHAVMALGFASPAYRAVRGGGYRQR